MVRAIFFFRSNDFDIISGCRGSKYLNHAPVNSRGSHKCYTMVDASKLAFTPAVEISFIRPKYQKYIAVAIEGQVSSPSLSQAQKMRELDKEGKLNGDVIDGILSEPKKEVDKVIINSAELEKYFGKDKTPREMKDTILALLDEWKEKQPPELGKPDKKKDMEK